MNLKDNHSQILKVYFLINNVTNIFGVLKILQSYLLVKTTFYILLKQIINGRFGMLYF